MSLKWVEEAQLPLALLRRAPSMFSSVNGGGKLRAQGPWGEGRACACILPVAGDEEPCTFVGDAEFSQLGLVQATGSPGFYDKARPAWADAGHAQEHFERGRVHLYGEVLQVVDGPVRLRVELRVEVRVVLVDYLAHIEFVEAHKPIGLVEAMFAIEFHRPRCGQALIGGYRQVGAEEHAFERERAIERSR